MPPDKVLDFAMAKSIAFSTELLLRYSYIVCDLVSLQLLSDGDMADASDPNSPQYYRVHPLSTLFLRQTVEKEQKSPHTTITGATRLLYTAVDHPDETYGIAAQEIREEEINFLSVISVPFRNIGKKAIRNIAAECLLPVNIYDTCR